MNSKFSTICCLLAGTALLTGFAFVSNQDPWKVPEKYEKMANPVKSDEASLNTGKSLYTKHCQSCHGKKGMGDGTKAAQLKTSPGDFTKADFQKQSDGVLFFKSHEGKGDMPSFKKKIPDEEEMWSVVNYMRTFK